MNSPLDVSLPWPDTQPAQTAMMASLTEAALDAVDDSWFHGWCRAHDDELSERRDASPRDLPDLAGGIAWQLYERSMHPQLRRQVPPIGALRTAAEDAGVTGEFTALVLMQFLRFSFKFAHLAMLLDDNAHLDRRAKAGDSCVLAHTAVARMGSGDVGDVTAGLDLIAACRPQVAEVGYQLLQALWLAPVDLLDPAKQQTIATLMIGIGEEVRRVRGRHHSSLHLRLARAHQLLGESEQAMRQINLAITWAEDGLLAEQYIRERSNLAAVQALDADLRQHKEELRGVRQSLVTEVKHDVKRAQDEATDLLHSKVESAVAVNIQVLFAVIGLIGLGGGSYGIAAKTMEHLAPQWSWWQVSIVLAVPLGVMLAITLYVFRNTTRMARGQLRSPAAAPPPSPSTP